MSVRSVLCAVFSPKMLLVLLCAAPASYSMPAIEADSDVLVLFDAVAMPGNQRTFSDAEEVAGSKSFVQFKTLDEMGEQAFSLSYEIEHYGGVALLMPVFDLYGFDTLSFEAIQFDGSVPTVELQFEDDSGLRKHLNITSFLEGLGTEWKNIDVPLDQFLFFNSSGLERVVKVSFVIRKGQGETGFNRVRLLGKTGDSKKTAWVKPAYPEPTAAALPPGHGLWCYGSAEFIFERVARYNASAPDNTKIRYLFPQLGTVSFLGGDYSVHWKPDLGLELHRLFSDAGMLDVKILPMIDGLMHGAEAMNSKQWQSLAQEIGQLIDSEPAFYGFHFDVEPHDNVIYNLFSALRDSSGKPISAAVNNADTDLFRYTDFAVLMAYDLAGTPDELKRVSQKRVAGFVERARVANGRVMIGVPAIATHREFEATARTRGGPRESNGFEMVDFSRASIDVLAPLIEEDDPVFLGLGIWALHEQDGLHGPRDTLWYYPTTISEATWSLLRNPFLNRR